MRGSRRSPPVRLIVDDVVKGTTRLGLLPLLQRGITELFGPEVQHDLYTWAFGCSGFMS